MLFYSKIWCMVIKVINRLIRRMILPNTSFFGQISVVFVPVNLNKPMHFAWFPSIWQVQHKQVISALLHCTIKSYFNICFSSFIVHAPRHLTLLILIVLHYSYWSGPVLWIVILTVHIQCDPYLYVSCFSLYISFWSSTIESSCWRQWDGGILKYTHWLMHTWFKSTKPLDRCQTRPCIQWKYNSSILL